jgi:large subunit ribosomal protein L21
MYAIVKTGGKQYRVEEGQSLLVERLPVQDGAKAVLEPLLFVDGSNVVDGSDLSKVTVEARVVGHERGPKLRVVKFKPKRGYRRRTGHRQELTRIEVTSIKLGSRRSSSSARRGPKPVAAGSSDPAAAEAPAVAEAPAAAEAPVAEAPAAGKPRRARAKTTEGDEAPAKPATRRLKPESKPEEDDGA